MEKEKIPEIPKVHYIYKSKYIMAIIFGVISVVIAAFGFISWSIYLFSIGFALSSILFSFKYFEIEKLSIVAVIVATCSSLVVGYSIIRTELVNLVESLTAVQKVEQYKYYDPFDDFYDDFFEEFDQGNRQNDEPDFWS